MSTEEKTYTQLLEENHALRQRNAELETVDADLKRTEAILRQERNLLQRVMDTSPMGITLVNPQGHIMFANERAEQVLGLTKNDITERTYNAPAWRITDYDGQPFPDDRLPFARVMTTRQPVYDVRHAIEWPDGRRVLLSINAAPIVNADGTLDGMIATIEDVTANVDAEQKLQESEARFRELFENMPSGVAIYTVINQGEDFIFKDFNKAGERIDHDRRERLLGRSIFEVRPGVEKFGLIDVFRRVWATGKAESFPISFYEDGKLSGWYENWVYKLPSGEIVAVFDNITDQKQMEEALRQSEQKFRALFENMTEGVAMHTLIFDAAGTPVDYRILEVNPAYEHHTGLSNKVAAGKLASELYGTGTPPFFDVFGRVALTGEPAKVEVYFEPMQKHFRISICSPGKHQFATVFEDITARKNADVALREKTEELERFFTVSLDLLCIADVNGYFRRLNDAWKQTLGYELSDLEGHQFMEFVHPDDQVATLAAVAELSAGHNVINFVNRYRCRDGSYRWIEWRSTPFQGRLIYAAAHDITGYKQAEEQIRALNAELEARVQQRTAELEIANQDLQNFIALSSHDLKTPLRGIAQLATWLATDYASCFDAAGQQQVHLLLNRVKRMDNLLNGMLEYIAIGRVAGEQQTIHVQHVVRQVLAGLAVPPQTQIHVAPDLPVMVGEERRLAQVFQHLLSNAVNFMDKPQGRIAVSCQDAGRWWRFAVTDNGPGIDPKYHEKIFQIFQTLHRRDERDTLGIGLSIVKKIIELSGGKVWIDSAPGRGSTVYFTLPKCE